MKIIKVCGSLRFQQQMMEISKIMQLKGNCMLAPIYPINGDKDTYTEEKMNYAKSLNKEIIYYTI